MFLLAFQLPVIIKKIFEKRPRTNGTGRTWRFCSRAEFERASVSNIPENTGTEALV